MQQRQITSTEAIARAQRELQDLINQRNIRSQELMQTKRLSHDAAQRQAQREMQSSIAAAQRALQSSIAAENRKVQRETLEESRRVAVVNAESRNYAVYQQSVDRINSNTEIPATERAEMLKSAKQAHDVVQSTIQQVSKVKYEGQPYRPQA